MAIRNILKDGEETLKKRSREVQSFDSRLHMLLDDMKETMIQAEGLGLAAPQVGILRRVALVMDATGEILELINPEILQTAGSVDGAEGCLSFPELYCIVKRPERVTVRAQDRYGKYFEASGEGITARAFCHEIDHLNGIVFTDQATKILTAEDLENMRQGNG